MKRINFISVKMVRESSALYETNTISSPCDVYDIARTFLEDEDRESFVVFCLDTKNKVNAINTVSVGTLNSAPIHPREVFKPAILSNANAIILVHNHPSGDSTPSKEDIQITERLVECGKLLSIPVLDHVIVGYGRYTSLKERGVM